MSDAAAFAAMEAILSGEWDRFLLRLQAAIRERRMTPEYEAHIIAGSTEALIRVEDLPRHRTFTVFGEVDGAGDE